MVKHVEFRHPLSARQSSTCSNENKGTPKTNSCSDHQGNSMKTKLSNEMDHFELVATNGIEIDTNGTEISSHDKSNLSESKNISNIQNDTTSSRDITNDIQIKYKECSIWIYPYFNFLSKKGGVNISMTDQDGNELYTKNVKKSGAMRAVRQLPKSAKGSAIRNIAGLQWKL